MSETDSKSVVEKVINSRTFYNKDVLKGLLKYLYDAISKGKNVKEIDIAIDYFKRRENFTASDDTIVRVNIHKLRLLLDKYYSDEGKKDKIKLSIPKGSYTLIFSEKGNGSNSLEQSGSVGKITILAVVLIFSVIINIVLIINPINKNNLSYHPVWSDYSNSSKAVFIILGDPFFYTIGDSLSNMVVHRDLAVNSVSDIKNTDQKYYERLTYPYFSKNNVMPLTDIISALSPYKKEIQLQALSEIDADHIKKSNQIFIANINSFGLFSQFLEASSIRLTYNPRQIVLLNGLDTVIYKVPELVGDYYNDYAFLVKVPGPNNNLITMMGDFHASAIKGLSGMLLDQNKMEKLEKTVKEKYNTFPRYFEMIVKVSIYHHADFKTEVVYFNKLEFKEEEINYFPDMMN